MEPFNWNETAENAGLDYESARDATPRWYGVSFGNGNDGVSHMWPDYYVKTADPFLLAAAAMVGNFNSKDGREYAIAECQIDGEADYTISATIYDPPEDESESSDYEGWESWSSVNGAWIICEVFQVDIDDERSSAPRYDSLAECFDAETLLAAGAI